MAAPPRPPDVPTRRVPPPVTPPTGIPVTPGSTWFGMPVPVSHPTTFAGPPGVGSPTSRVVPGGIPGQPIYFQLPSPSPNDPYPGYISPQDLRMLALQQVALENQPQLNELRAEQRRLSDRDKAELAGIQAITQLLAGFGGPQSQIDAFEGQQRYLAALQQNNAYEADMAGKIQDLLAGQPGAAQKVLDDLQKQQSGLYSDYASAHKPIIRSVGGSLVAIDPSTGETQVLYGGGPSATKWQTRSVGGNLYRVDPATGKSELLIKAPPKASSNKPITKTVGGSLYEWDPQSRQWNVAIQKPEAATSYQHTTINGKVYLFDKSSGTFYDPATMQPIVPKNSPPKGVTGKTIATGRQIIAQGKRGYWSRIGDTKPLTTSELRGVISDFNALKLKNKKGQVIRLTLADLPNLTPEQQQHLGIYQAKPTADQIYLHLVKDIGIPSRRAWQLVRAQFPGWGKGYYRPKADAATETAAYPGSSPIPLTAGKLIGYPNQGSHTLYGNWQSDNAVDFSAPVGTPIYAVADGVIGPRIGPFASRDPHLSGSRVTVIGGGNEFYYAHLSRLAVKAGQRVKKGQLIGYSGSANGVNHLHFAVKNGSPQDYFQDGGAPTRSLASASGPRAIGQQGAAKYGWTGKEWSALDQLWQHESKWDPTAKNPASGAAGIPQALGHQLPPGYANDPAVQIAWGLKYIKDTYRTPSRAWAFWRATVYKNANLAPADLRAKARYWISKNYGGY